MENSSNEPTQDTTSAPPVQDGAEDVLPTPAHEEVERVHEQVAQDDDDRVISGSEEPPSRTDEDPGDDNDVPADAAPQEHSVESVEADQEDDKGAEV